MPKNDFEDFINCESLKRVGDHFPRPQGAARILDLGFWILAFGFWNLEFGFWIMDFGFGTLDLPGAGGTGWQDPGGTLAGS